MLSRPSLLHITLNTRLALNIVLSGTHKKPNPLAMGSYVKGGLMNSIKDHIFSQGESINRPHLPYKK